MKVHTSTAKSFAREGVVRAVRADDSGLLLFEPTPPARLPHAHPGKRLRDRRQHPQLASWMPNEVQYEA